MKKKDRWEIIKQECQKRGFLSIEDAHSLFSDASRELVHRDLRELASEDLQISWEPGRRGNAGRIVWNSRAQLDYSVRLDTNVDEKEKIAEVAARFIRAAEVVFVDSGSTQSILVEYAIKYDLLREIRRVYTTSLDIAMRLVEWQKKERIPELGYVIGGPIRTINRDLTGDEGWDALPQSQRFDVAFISTPGVDKAGFLSVSPREAASRMQAIARANAVVMLADHTKFDQDKVRVLFQELARSYFGRFRGKPSCEGFYLLSDDGLLDADRKRLEASGITVYTNETPAHEIRLPVDLKYSTDL